MTAVPINPIRPIRRPPCFLLKAMNIKKNNFAQEDDGVSGEFTVELSSARVRLIVNEGYCIQFNKGGARANSTTCASSYSVLTPF